MATTSVPAARTRPQSDTPEAERMRRYRARKREARASGATPVTNADPNANVTPPPAPPAASSGAGDETPWHTTEPIRGPGPEAFAVPLVLPNENAPNAEPEPFAPPPPEPAPTAPPPLTAVDVAPIVEMTMQFIKAGCAVAFLAYAPELAPLGIDGTKPMHPTVEQVVHKSVEAVCMKYNIRVPYQDELVVCTAVGVAAFGFTRGRARLEERAKTPVAPPANENARTHEASSTSNATQPEPVDVDAMPIVMPAPAASDE